MGGIFAASASPSGPRNAGIGSFNVCLVQNRLLTLFCVNRTTLVSMVAAVFAASDQSSCI